MFYFLLGLCVGSFLNVVINRLETKESIFFGRSHCPKCKTVLKWYDLIPLASFFLLRGRCRKCRKKISWQYPLVELATGLLFLLSRNPLYLIIVSFLIVIFVYDLKHYIIPDSIVYPAIIIGFFYAPFSVYSLVGAAFFLLIVLGSRGKWMGLGDVKLAVLMGFVLGWPMIVPALLLSFVLGAAVGVVLILMKKKELKSEIPFGPFLCLATLVMMLYGPQIVNWYWRLCGIMCI